MQQSNANTCCVTARLKGSVDSRQRQRCIAIDQRLEQRLKMFAALGCSSGSDNLIQCRERVASRSATRSDDILSILGSDLDASVTGDMVDQFPNLASRQQRELEVLRAASDRWHNLVRFGCAQHEHDMRRWLFKRFEKSVLGTRRQHVNFVEDVDLCTAGRPECNLADEITYGVDTIVGRSIELMQVIASTGQEGQARITFVARFTALQISAVQCLGQDASRRRLACATRAAEQIRVTDSVSFDGITQRSDHMVLPEERVLESRGSVTPVQRLIGH
jgi:hypothetical protein